MIKYLFIILICFSVNSFAQSKLTKEDFLKKSKTFPDQYKNIIGNSNGWRVVGRYYFYNDKIDKPEYKWDTLQKFTPFRDGKMFTKISGKKIIGRGDIHVVRKIKFVNSDTLILEEKTIRKIKGKNEKVKVRTIYKSV